MKNKVLQLILFIGITLWIVGCGLFGRKKPADTEKPLGSPAMFGETMTLDSLQLDSLCVADTIARDLNLWLFMSYKDYETGEPVYKYAYIKEINDSTEIAYILTPKDSLFTVLKRTVVNVEEGDE